MWEKRAWARGILLLSPDWLLNRSYLYFATYEFFSHLNPSLLHTFRHFERCLDNVSRTKEQKAFLQRCIWEQVVPKTFDVHVSKTDHEAYASIRRLLVQAEISSDRLEYAPVCSKTLERAGLRRYSAGTCSRSICTRVCLRKVFPFMCHSSTNKKTLESSFRRGGIKPYRSTPVFCSL